MYFKEFRQWLRAFWEHNFAGSLHFDWGANVQLKYSESFDIIPIKHWIALFFIFSIALIFIGSKTKIIEKLSKHILLLSLITWVGGVCIYIVGFYNRDVNGLSVVLRAIISSFKMFTVSNELARVPIFLQHDASYMTVFAVLHFAAAFITSLFIFKMVGYKIKSSWNLIRHKWFHSNNKVVHLFWGINEASLALAKDINTQHDSETIIFIDIDKESDDDTQKKATLSHITNTITIKNSDIVRLESIGALVDHCYNGPAALKDNDTDIFEHLNLRTVGAIVQRCSKANFYFLSNDEAQNIAGALNLQKDRRIRSMKASKPTVYIHARRDANNEIFDHYSQYDEDSERMQLKIVDSAYLSIASLKQEERALPVNCVEKDPATGFVDSPFSALIVGFGETGQEAFKFLYEFSAFVGSDMKKSQFKCYVIDEKMNKKAGLIRKKMPNISEDELLLIQDSVDSETFWDTVSPIISTLNYVVITLNNDALGLSLAVNLFKYALRNRPTNQPMLKIFVRCYANDNEKRMTEVANNLNKSVEGSNVEISLFGQTDSIYRCKTILSDELLQEAMEFNKVYENSEKTAKEQWEINFGEGEILRLMTNKKMSRYHAIHDINRRIAQNISNAQHKRTKMILMGFDDSEQSPRLKQYYGYANSREKNTTKYQCGKQDEQLLLNMAMVEHERWIASHKLMGYQYAPEGCPVKKYHQDMCPWQELSEFVQSYDCNVVDTTIKLAYQEATKNK